jgi:hypothetical protein
MAITMQSHRQRSVGLWVVALTLLWSTGVDGVNSLPWQSGFESGDFSEWSGSQFSKLPQIETEGCFAGQFCSRIPLAIGSKNDYYVNHHFGDFHNPGQAKIEEVYLRFHVRFSDGYRWPAPHDNIKIALINSTDGASGRRRYQVYVYVDSSGLYTVDYSYIDSWRFFGLRQNQGTPAGPRRGDWDKLKLYVRLNAPGKADGIVRFWVNDRLKLDHQGLNLREQTNYGMNRLILSGYTRRASGGAGFLYHDEWTLSATDPDQNQ